MSHFIDVNKGRKIRDLKELLPSHIVEKIVSILILVSNILDKMVWCGW